MGIKYIKKDEKAEIAGRVLLVGNHACRSQAPEAFPQMQRLLLYSASQSHLGAQNFRHSSRSCQY